eukprot:scpid95529/ scgid13480/ 
MSINTWPMRSCSNVRGNAGAGVGRRNTPRKRLSAIIDPKYSCYPVTATTAAVESSSLNPTRDICWNAGTVILLAKKLKNIRKDSAGSSTKQSCIIEGQSEHY